MIQSINGHFRHMTIRPCAKKILSSGVSGYLGALTGPEEFCRILRGRGEDPENLLRKCIYGRINRLRKGLPVIVLKSKINAIISKVLAVMRLGRDII